MGERKLVTIDQIVDIQPITNADFIEMVQVRNWQCVAKKGDFQLGDLCVYFEIDSLIPVADRFDFLKCGGIKSVEINGDTFYGYRIRTQKYKNQIAQGLALPFSFFEERNTFPTEIGSDVTSLFSVVKWELPLYTGMGIMNQYGVFPMFIPKTNEQRIQNLDLNTIQNKVWGCFEKVDGTSATYYRYEGEFGMCCHEWRLRDDTLNLFVTMADKYNLREVIPEGFAIQGEIVGPGIQSNRQKFPGKRFMLFHVFNIVKQCYVDWYHDGLFWELDRVPFMYYLNSCTDQFMDINEWLGLAMSLGKNKEGIVLSRFNKNLPFGKESFKVINNNYLV